MMRNNVFFDTCVYHLPGIELLTKVVPVDNILFGSEMVGAVRGIDPRTGHYYDDTKRYLTPCRSVWKTENDLEPTYGRSTRINKRCKVPRNNAHGTAGHDNRPSDLLVL
jgi:hypothetical protein